MDEAKKAFEKYLEIAPKEWRSYRNLALYYVETKDSDNTLKYLEQAIGLGFNDKKWLKENSSFKTLKKNSRFRKLLKQLKYVTSCNPME